MVEVQEQIALEDEGNILEFNKDKELQELQQRYERISSSFDNSNLEDIQRNIANINKRLEWNRRRKAELEEEVRQRFAPHTDPDTLDKLCRIAVQIKLNRGICVEELASQLDLDYPETLTLVGTLETEGFIVTDLLQRCSILVRN